MRTFTVLLAALALLTGCSSKPEPQVAARKPLPPWPEATAAKPAARPAPVALADPNEAVWQLRAGLNVAALICKGKGRAPVSGDYARLLTRHKGLFAAAHAAEQKRRGSGFDRHQTRLYNRFSNQRDPVRFCRDAAGVARRAVAMDSPGLSRSASSLVGELN